MQMAAACTAWQRFASVSAGLEALSAKRLNVFFKASTNSDWKHKAYLQDKPRFRFTPTKLRSSKNTQPIHDISHNDFLFEMFTSTM